MSIATMAAFVLLTLQLAMHSITLIKTSCRKRELVKPFCALDVILSITVLSLLFSAREIILYRFESNEIVRQFFNLLKSPFFGISLTQAVLKEPYKCPFSKQHNAYLNSGVLR